MLVSYMSLACCSDWLGAYVLLALQIIDQKTKRRVPTTTPPRFESAFAAERKRVEAGQIRPGAPYKQPDRPSA